MAETPITVIIVAFRCDDLLRNCLDSLTLARPDVEMTTVVVDNASDAGTRALVASFDDAHYIDPGANVGFSRANNAVLASHKAGHVLLLNPDTVVPRGVLKRLLHAFEDRPEVGMIGPKLVTLDGD